MVVGVISILLERQWTLLGSSSNALILGMVLRNLNVVSSSLQEGIKLAEKKTLSLAIMCIGASINVQTLSTLDNRTLLVTVITSLSAVGIAYALGFLFKLKQEASLLLGIGTAICGSAAIASCSPILQKDEQEETGSIITAVNLIGLIGIFIIPSVSSYLSLPTLESGLLAGASLHGVGHVVASAFSISPEVGQLATTVKMCRVFMLVPLILVLLSYQKRQGAKSGQAAFPLYLIGFLCLLALNNLIIFPDVIRSTIEASSRVCIAAAMAGIGLNIHFSAFLKSGSKLFLIGSFVSFCHISLILFLIKVFY